MTEPSTSLGTRVGVLFDEHAQVIFEYASRRVGGAVAREVVSDVFLIALQRLNSFDPSMGSERGWLFGIANNVLRHHRRSEVRRIRAYARSHVTAVAPDGTASSDARMDASAAVRRLAVVISDLDGDDRDLLAMYAWQGLSYQEIADVLRVPIGTVRSRLHRLRVRLAEHLGSNGNA